MVSRDLLIAMAKAHDAEQASHMGEPSPWSDDDLDPEWIDERVTCMELALEVYRRDSEQVAELKARITELEDWQDRALEVGGQQERELNTALAQVAELVEALERIATYAPKHTDLTDEQKAEMEACADCAVCRERQWPPSRLCDKHYRLLEHVRQTNERLWNGQGYEMRRIAHDALAKYKEQQSAEDAPAFPHKACGTYNECRREGICLDGWRCVAEHKERQP